MTLVPKVRLASYATACVLVISGLSWFVGCLLMYVVFFRYLFVDLKFENYSPGFTIPMSLVICGFFVIGDVYVYRRVTLQSVVFSVGLTVIIMLLMSAVLYVGLAVT